MPISQFLLIGVVVLGVLIGQHLKRRLFIGLIAVGVALIMMAIQMMVDGQGAFMLIFCAVLVYMLAIVERHDLK